MDDFDKGVAILDHVIQQSLVNISAPFLLPSRIPNDIRQLKHELKDQISNLESNDWNMLLPILFRLQGYEISRKAAVGNLEIWELQLAGQETHFTGFGAAMDETTPVANLEDLLTANEYSFGLLYASDRTSVTTYSARLHIIDDSDFLSNLLAIALGTYVELFSMTLNAVPGLKEHLNDGLHEVANLRWEYVSTISKRWQRCLDEVAKHHQQESSPSYQIPTDETRTS